MKATARPRANATTTAAGVRLLTVDRPGYGGSDPRPDPTLLGWAEDVQVPADRLHLERFAVVGFSAGDGYALACAAGMLDRISLVGLASCEGPYDEVPGALEEEMPPEERTLFERIRRDPDGHLLLQHWDKILAVVTPARTIR